VMPDGTTQPLSTLHVRATEYTVGPRGPDAMPAPLPPTTGYTYAAELSVDEAQASGATEVRFSQPVPFYLENFLGLPVGMALPVGFYDRKLAVWKPSADGRVIRVHSIAGGTAEIDVSGSGSPAGAAELGALGFTVAERQRIATLYAAGQSLWRVRLPHFSSIDINLPVSPPDGASDPNGEEASEEDESPEDECNQTGSSWIGCESQTLGEALAVVGTPYRLVYQSRRAPGHEAGRSLRIPLSGASVPSGLKRIELTVDVGGRRIRQSFTPAANLATKFTWDGRDAYGRAVTGALSAAVRVGFVYDGVYQVPPALSASFGTPSGVASTVSARQEVTQVRETVIPLGAIGGPSFGVGGWSLDVHHTYDPIGRTLYTGDGRRVRADAVPSGIVRIAGTGSAGGSGDGGPAVSATLSGPRGIAAGPDGSVYIVDRGNARIRRIGPDGRISTIAGGGTLTSDSVPATQARLFSPVAIALAPDGSYYIADQSSRRTYKVSPNGLFTFFAGNGTTGFSGDGGPATQAAFREPFGVAVGPDGSVYIIDVLNFRVRRVTPDGVVTTFAGGGSSFDDGGPATTAHIDEPLGVVVDKDGVVYISTYRGATFVPRVRRVGTDGIISTVAGGGAGAPADGANATDVRFEVPIGLSIAGDGTLYLSEQELHRVWRLTQAGVLSLAAGTGQACQYQLPSTTCGDGGPPTQARLNRVVSTFVDHEDRLLIAELSSNIIRRLAPTLPGFTGGGMLLAAGDPGELYEFDQAGRHLRTIHGYTGATLLSFGYDGAGGLTTVTDGDGGVTTVERNTGGAPIAIRGPDGQRNTLELSVEGYLSRVTDPGNRSWNAAYGAGGLLSTVTDPNTNSSQYTYG
ncbi:MAG: RHS repeat-associated core domain-containing protein, partial [Gemmatimonadales bacterium]